MNALLDDLKWRGLLAQSTDEAALAAHLDTGPVTFYVGFDPSAPSLHIGNLVQLIVARKLQEAGHRPLLLVGGATGLIGDPKQTGERVMNPKELVTEWVERIRSQVSGYVSFEGDNAAQLVNNLDWTGSMSALDFLRDVGKHFPVNRMLDRQIVSSRLESGISYTEFSYVLLQSMDYRELYRRYSCTLQSGGSDQWGNITAGVELIRRSEGATVHALATPLITKADGTKFGKTEGGAIWLDPTMLSPYGFYQIFLNAEDSKAIDYLKVFGNRSRDEIAELQIQTEQAPQRRLAQHALAADVTDLVHGVAAREQAEAASAAVFGGGAPAALGAGVLEALYSELGGGELPQMGGLLPLVSDVLVAAKVVASKSAARRAIDEGGAYLNNVKVTDVDARLRPEDLLQGQFALVRRGRKTTGVVRVAR